MGIARETKLLGIPIKRQEMHPTDSPIYATAEADRFSAFDPKAESFRVFAHEDGNGVNIYRGDSNTPQVYEKYLVNNLGIIVDTEHRLIYSKLYRSLTKELIVYRPDWPKKKRKNS